MSERRARLAEGAAEFAPTAPHATPRAGRSRANVGRLWRPLRVVLGVAMLASLGVHGGLAIKAFGQPPEVDFLDNNDELTIPIDMFEEAPPPAPAPAPQEAPPTSHPEKPGDGFLDAGVHLRDAGADAAAVHDAGPHDAGSDAGHAPRDAGGIPLSDGLHGEGDAGPGDGGVDGGGVGSGPRDPASIVGMPGLSNSGPVNVTLLVNMAAIRQHPVGRRIGPLIQAIPQWDSFTHGSETNVDPLRDTNWIMVYGPSLIHTEKDAVLVSYSASDAVVDKAIELVSERYDKGGPFDTGVAGVKASIGHADNAERVFLRASSKLLAVVPPDKAKEFARLLKGKGAKPRINASEAMRLIVRNPHRQIAIRGLKFPTELEELRIWIVPNADGSATIHAEGTVTPPDECDNVASTMTEVLRRVNSGWVQAGTGGLLNNLAIRCDEGVPKGQINASQKQMEQILTAISLILGVPLGQ